MKLWLFGIILAGVLTLPACGLEEGLASWYGMKFYGKTTANGEKFDTNNLTAAHRTLPFGSLVKVTNLFNGESVVVRINDRGPFVKGRIIDLSRAAAEALNMINDGVAKVRLELFDALEGDATDGTKDSDKVSGRIPDTGSNAANEAPGFTILYAIQVGAFSLRENAEKLKNNLSEKGFEAALEETETGVTRVLIPNVSGDDIFAVKAKLRIIGIQDVLVRSDITVN